MAHLGLWFITSLFSVSILNSFAFCPFMHESSKIPALDNSACPQPVSNVRENKELTLIPVNALLYIKHFSKCSSYNHSFTFSNNPVRYGLCTKSHSLGFSGSKTQTPIITSDCLLHKVSQKIRLLPTYKFMVTDLQQCLSDT